MGMFDDLMPAPTSGGMFDDLIPAKEAVPVVEPVKSYDDAINNHPKIKAYREVLAALDPRDAGAISINKGIEREVAKITELEQLREKNPYLASIIEEMPEWKKSAVNFGRGITDIGRALGIVGEEDQKEALDALQGQSQPGARTLGQMAPFIPLGGAVGLGAKAVGMGTVPTTAAYSALGATEGYTSAAGEGRDPILSTAIGALAPPLAVIAPKLISSAAGAVTRKLSSADDIKNILGAAQPDETVVQIERLLKKGTADAGDQIKQLLISSDTTAHPTLKKVAETVAGGGTSDDIAEVIAAQKLKGTEGAAAKFSLEANKVVSSPKAKELIRQGMPPEDVQFIKASSAADKEAYNKMIDYAERGVKSSSAKNVFHPQSIVGDSVHERLKAVQELNKKAGGNIDRISRKTLKGKPIVLDEPMGKFITKLKDLGVTFKKGNIDFDGSALMDLPKAQAPIKRILNRLDPKRNPNVTAYDAHILKKWFDSNINYGKTPTSGGIDPAVERAIKGFRKDINEAIGAISPEYKAVNAQYADTIGKINDFKSIAGKKTNLAGDYAEESLGMLSKRVTSNAMSRGAVKEAIKGLEDVAAKYGKVFDTKVVDQVQFVNAMEKTLGAFSDTSLLGQVSTANKLSSKRGLTVMDAGVEALDYVTKKLKPQDKEAYIKALRALVNE